MFIFQLTKIIINSCYCRSAFERTMSGAPPCFSWILRIFQMIPVALIIKHYVAFLRHHVHKFIWKKITSFLYMRILNGVLILQDYEVSCRFFSIEMTFWKQATRVFNITVWKCLKRFTWNKIYIIHLLNLTTTS